MTERDGQCLCGEVRFRAVLSNTAIQACHCKQCQRWTGGGPLYSVRVDSIELEGDNSFGRYRASAWGERVFCNKCGSTLFWRMQGGDVKHISPGLLNDQTGLEVGEEIFCDYRPDWLPHFDKAAQSTEAQEMAKLKAFQESQK